MQPQENPARVLLGLHGDCIEGFLLKNLYCLECTVLIRQILMYKDGPYTERSKQFKMAVDPYANLAERAN